MNDEMIMQFGMSVIIRTKPRRDLQDYQDRADAGFCCHLVHRVNPVYVFPTKLGG